MQYWDVFGLSSNCFIPCCIGLQKPQPSPRSQPQKPQRQQLDIQNGSMWSVDVYGIYSTHHLEAKAVRRSYKYTQVWHVHVGIKGLYRVVGGVCQFLDGNPIEGAWWKYWFEWTFLFCRSMSEGLPHVTQLLCRVNCWRQLMPRTGTRHAWVFCTVAFFWSSRGRLKLQFASVR